MRTFDILKGDTVVGWIEITDETSPEGTLHVGNLLGTKACDAAGISWDDFVYDYGVDWDRLDNDRELDAQPWWLKPNDGKVNDTSSATHAGAS